MTVTPEPSSNEEHLPPSVVLRWAAAGTIGVLGVLLAAFAIYVIRDILVLVFIALFLAISLEPAVTWLIHRGIRRSYAVAIVITVLIGLFVLFVWSLVPPLVNQGGKLLGALPGHLQRLSTESAGVRAVTDRYHLTERLSAAAGALPSRLADGAVGFTHRFLGLIASTGTVLVLTMYFMADMDRIRRIVVRVFPRSRRARVSEVVDIAVDKVGGYMIGNLLISLIAGASTFLCLLLLGVPYALPLAVTVAITDLIPMIGGTLGGVICVGVALFTEGIWPAAVIVTVFFIVYQQIENYLIAPRVLRGAVNLSSVGVLLVALVGGTVLGLVGALIAIPIAATVKVVMSPDLGDDPVVDAAVPGPPTGSAGPHL